MYIRFKLDHITARNQMPNFAPCRRSRLPYTMVEIDSPTGRFLPTASPHPAKSIQQIFNAILECQLCLLQQKTKGKNSSFFF